LQSASEAKIKFYMIMTDEFVLSINSCWNAASNSLFLRGVRINPQMLKRRSTGAEEGKEVLRRTNVAVAGKSLQYF